MGYVQGTKMTTACQRIALDDDPRQIGVNSPTKTSRAKYTGRPGLDSLPRVAYLPWQRSDAVVVAYDTEPCWNSCHRFD